MLILNLNIKNIIIQRAFCGAKPLNEKPELNINVQHTYSLGQSWGERLEAFILNLRLIKFRQCSVKAEEYLLELRKNMKNKNFRNALKQINTL